MSLIELIDKEAKPTIADNYTFANYLYLGTYNTQYPELLMSVLRVTGSVIDKNTDKLVRAIKIKYYLDLHTKIVKGNKSYCLFSHKYPYPFD